VEDDEGAAAAPLNDEVLLTELAAPVGETAADAWRAASASFNLSPEDKRWLISEPERSKDNASAACAPLAPQATKAAASAAMSSRGV
jgi:hypothetical protein